MLMSNRIRSGRHAPSSLIAATPSNAEITRKPRRSNVNDTSLRTVGLSSTTITNGRSSDDATVAGGLKEFAKGKNISVLRTEDGRQVVHQFNYQDALNRKNLEQNIELLPGDTVLVP